ncbi:virulence factor Mce family protein [Nocardia amikacinitolerans]|uniref:MCE family protein n=1 Tax=Nocardia amikacinitolerans TaxID=756689 RepID=UPI000836DB7B|nr:MCE family protein [Nocardia amikacinitolerans]MCP2319998.1 virulence factor Mce family protein [Nocardia amikacinitolerans]
MTNKFTPAIAGAVAALSISGCAVTVDNVPLPKPGVAGPSYRLHAVFDNALNLPERARVKIGGTDIGVVSGIDTVGWRADVELEIRADIALPEGSRAELRQSTPLGDIFVAVTLPQARSEARMLGDGDRIDREHTSAGASVEELMTSMSMLLNGGGLNQAARITSEMNSMVEGRGPQLAHLLTELTSALSALNARTDQIDSLLGGLAALSATLEQRKAELGAAAETFPDLIGVLAENNRGITELATKVSVTMAALGDFTATTGPQFVSLFDSVQRLMDGFTRMGDHLAGTLDGLHTLYPALMATTEGSTLAVAATISYLSVGALTDPRGSKLPDGSDLTAFVGSLAEVIARVIGRLQGGHR